MVGAHAYCMVPKTEISATFCFQLCSATKSILFAVSKDEWNRKEDTDKGPLRLR